MFDDSVNEELIHEHNADCHGDVNVKSPQTGKPATSLNAPHISILHHFAVVNVNAVAHGQEGNVNTDILQTDMDDTEEQE